MTINVDTPLCGPVPQRSGIIFALCVHRSWPFIRLLGRDAASGCNALVCSALKDGLFDIDLVNGRRSFSPHIHAMLGVSEGGLASEPAHLLPRLFGADEAVLDRAFQEAVSARADRFSCEVRLRHQGDYSVPVVVHATLAYAEDGQPRRVAGRIALSGARSHSDRRREAFYDYLTGLPNRALVFDRLEQRLRQLRREPDTGFAVFFLDLDNFKTVNDSLGHSSGDEILVAMARRLEQIVRTTDTIARLGGDEFVLVVDGVASVKDVDAVIARLHEALDDPIQSGDQAIAIDCSIGVVLSRDATARPEDLLRDADVALYEAKKGGRGRYVIFDEAMRAAVSSRMHLERDLRNALAANQFELFYQPIVETASGTLAGFEALIRWRHPERGLIAPGEFITVAEETGLILSIGQWVIRTAIHQLAEWRRQGMPNTPVAVNVSALQFGPGGALVETIADALAEYQVPPCCLKIEVTESLVSANPEAAADILGALSQMGVLLAIDDFGTGHSSLSRLLGMPFDTIKIDRAFVARVEREPRSIEIIEAINDIAARLGMEVVVEGVETRGELAALSKVGCRYSQGYLFAKPLSADNAERLLRTGTFSAAAAPFPASLGR